MVNKTKGKSRTQNKELLMTKSIAFYLGRDNKVQVFEPDKLPHTDGLSPLMLLVIDVINAGYEGVIVDEEPLSNGRIFQGLNVNLATPEGLLLQYISDVYAESGELPMTSNEVLKVLAMAYKLKGAKT